MGDDGASIVTRDQKWRLALETAPLVVVLVVVGGDGPMLKCTKVVNVDLDAFPLCASQLS